MCVKMHYEKVELGAFPFSFQVSESWRGNEFSVSVFVIRTEAGLLYDLLQFKRGFQLTHTQQVAACADVQRWR